jgi:hypothetical protein
VVFILAIILIERYPIDEKTYAAFMASPKKR